MTSQNCVFRQSINKYGKLEFDTDFGRNKTLVFRQSARGFYYVDLCSGNSRVNLGLDELDAIFSMRGHLESLTTYFPQKENESSVPRNEESSYRPASSVATTSNVNSTTYGITTAAASYTPLTPPLEAMPSTSRNVLQEIEKTDTHNIPIQVSYKRQANQGQVPLLEIKRSRYDFPTHVGETPDLYNFSEQEVQEFFQPMN